MDDWKCRDLIDRYIAAYNTFDIDGMAALLSPGVRFENYSGGQLTASTSGIDEFRQLAEKSRSLFSEREQRISSFRCYPDSATADITYRGHLLADIPGGPAAGTVVVFSGRSNFFFDNGQITKIVDHS
jgi:hypothetical protein